jgi:hypothetical protein
MLDLNAPIVVSGEMKNNLIAELNTLAEWVDDPALGASSANRVICYMSVLMDELEKAYCSALFVTQMAARLKGLLSLIAKFHNIRKPPEMPVLQLFSETEISSTTIKTDQGSMKVLSADQFDAIVDKLQAPDIDSKALLLDLISYEGFDVSAERTRLSAAMPCGGPIDGIPLQRRHEVHAEIDRLYPDLGMRFRFSHHRRLTRKVLTEMGLIGPHLTSSKWQLIRQMLRLAAIDSKADLSFCREYGYLMYSHACLLEGMGFASVNSFDDGALHFIEIEHLTEEGERFLRLSESESAWDRAMGMVEEINDLHAESLIAILIQDPDNQPAPK